MPNEQNTKSIIDELTEILKSNHNLILTGAPGTGKTYLAKQIAAKMLGLKEYNESIEENHIFTSHVGFIQFHPSYDYTDFVEGLRPTEKDGNITFERTDGIFKKFCKDAIMNNDGIVNESFIGTELSINTNDKTKNLTCKIVDLDLHKNLMIVPTGYATPHYFIIGYEILRRAYSEGIKPDDKDWFANELKVKYFTKQNPKIIDFYKAIYTALLSADRGESSNNKYVFIIDEINRGEISKIFGELFFSIDPGYRGLKGRVKTQYQNIIKNDDVFKDGFYVPDNVYIIGTMNDIDRSVESMDFAFRRRFAFREIKANDTTDMLNSLDQDIKATAEGKMKALNDTLSNVAHLTDAYHIGASYFMKLKEYGNDFDKLWEYHLEGILLEYLRGSDSINAINMLKKAYITGKSQGN